MNADLNILKNIFNHKDWFSVQTLSDEGFLINALHGIISFEENPEFFNQIILENSSQKINSEEIQNFYEECIDQLAELYSLEDSKINPDLFKNKGFKERFKFYQLTSLAIAKLERTAIKETFSEETEITDEMLAKTIQIHSRKKLKDKFKAWDQEENVKSNHRFLWFKLGIAASVLLVAGIFIFQKSPGHSMEIATEERAPEEPATKDEDTNNRIEKVEIQIAEISRSSENIELLEPASLGFSNTGNNNIKVEFISQTERISSLKEAIKTEPNTEYENELSELKKKQNKYVFNGKKLELYDFKNHSFKILKLNDKYYIQIDNSFNKLEITNTVRTFEKETDSDITDNLEKIIFDND